MPIDPEILNEIVERVNAYVPFAGVDEQARVEAAVSDVRSLMVLAQIVRSPTLFRALEILRVKDQRGGELFGLRLTATSKPLPPFCRQCYDCVGEVPDAISVCHPIEAMSSDEDDAFPVYDCKHCPRRVPWFDGEDDQDDQDDDDQDDDE